MSMNLITSLLLILASAWVLGSLFARFGLPVMLGELSAGLVLGPPVLGIIAGSPELDLMADFGVFFVMFYAGMEMDPKELRDHLRPSIFVAAGGFVLPFGLGYLTAALFGGTFFQSLFIGLGISITALAVQSVVLKSMRINRTYLGHILIGAAVFNDILALVGLAVLLGLVETGGFSPGGVAVVLLKVIAFFGLTIAVGEVLMPRITGRVRDKEARGFTFALLAALAMALLAEVAGLHPIMGAFLAGQYVRKEIMDDQVYLAIADRFYGISYGFLVPVFFVSLSFNLHFEWSLAFWGFTAALTLAAVVGKFAGSGLVLRMMGWSRAEAVLVGYGMNSRGSMELVVAAVVMEISRQLLTAGRISEALLTPTQFSALVIMAFATTLLAPLGLKRTVLKTCLPDEGADFCKMLDESGGR